MRGNFKIFDIFAKFSRPRVPGKSLSESRFPGKSRFRKATLPERRFPGKSGFLGFSRPRPPGKSFSRKVAFPESRPPGKSPPPGICAPGKSRPRPPGKSRARKVGLSRIFAALSSWKVALPVFSRGYQGFSAFSTFFVDFRRKFSRPFLPESRPYGNSPARKVSRPKSPIPGFRRLTKLSRDFEVFVGFRSFRGVSKFSRISEIFEIRKAEKLSRTIEIFADFGNFQVASISRSRRFSALCGSRAFRDLRDRDFPSCKVVLP